MTDPERDVIGWRSSPACLFCGRFPADRPLRVPLDQMRAPCATAKQDDNCPNPPPRTDAIRFPVVTYGQTKKLRETPFFARSEAISWGSVDGIRLRRVTRAENRGPRPGLEPEAEPEEREPRASSDFRVPLPASGNRVCAASRVGVLRRRGSLPQGSRSTPSIRNQRPSMGRSKTAASPVQSAPRASIQAVTSRANCARSGSSSEMIWYRMSRSSSKCARASVPSNFS